MAVAGHDLNTAEVAYALINEVNFFILILKFFFFFFFI